MKERVLGALSDLSRNPDKRSEKTNTALLPILVRETGLDESTIQKKAAETHEMILHNYSDFAISTIDSFSHRIIRTFARDFGLPMNFNVELDSDELFQKTIDLLMDKAGDDEEITSLLVKFLESRMDEERSWNIEKTLLEFAQVLLDEDAKQHLSKLKNLTLKEFSAISDIIYRQIRQYEERIKKIACEAVELIRSRNIQESSFYYGSTGISRYFLKLSKEVNGNIEPNSRVQTTIEQDNWIAGKALPEDRTGIEAIKDDLRSYYNRINPLDTSEKIHYYLLKALTGTIFPLTMLNEIEKILEDYKKQNNIVHIAEFNQRISGIIMNEPIPFIYERLGEKYHHILIDEFQDTSVLQWQNLLPLIENSLAYGYFNLIVGDGKQAIYRWRNGDVDQFTALPAISGSQSNPVLAERESLLRSQYNEEQLNKNFRSATKIVDFNNRFFTSILPVIGESGRKVYDKLEQQSDPEKSGGYVSLSFIDKEEEENSYKDLAFENILKIIHELEADQFHLRDIAILCRRNKEAGEIARFLAENDIRITSAESLILSYSSEVNFLVAFLRLLHEPESMINTAAVITFLHIKMKLPGSRLDELLFKIKSGSHSSHEPFTLLKEYGFELSPDSLRILPLYDFFEKIIRTFSLNDPANPYIQFFLDEVLKYSRKNESSGIGFLEWWEEKKEKKSVVVPQGLDAISIMSIHKAKGLQFPVVIFPVFPLRKRLTRDFLWVDIPYADLNGLTTCMLATNKAMENTGFSAEKQQEEEKSLLDLVNVLYVAHTRPEDRLYLLSPMPPKSAQKTESVPGFYQYFLRSENIWSEEKRFYEWGDRSICKAKSTGEPFEHLSLTSFISEDWHNKVFIRRSAPESWDVDDPQRNRHWGNLVHTILSRIITSDDVETVIETAVQEGLIEGNQQNPLTEKIKTVITHKEAGRFFEKDLNVKTEAEIVIEDGTVYRPDRIILKGDEAIIIDYKTGKPEEKYHKQMKIYNRLLKELGFSDVKTYLLYIDPEVQVTEIN